MSVLIISIFVVLLNTSYVNAATTFARVQGPCRGTTTSAISLSVTMTSTPTVGNTLIAVVGGQFASISSVTETGVTWAKAVSYYLSGYYSVEIWYGTVASSAGTSVLFTFSSTSGYAAADICEYSGLASSPVDKTATNTGDSTSLDTGTTAPTSQANELFVGATVGYGATQSSPTNGFTLLDGAADTATSLAYLENIVSATGTADSGASLPAAHHWIGCIATFLISGSTPSPSPSPTPSPSPFARVQGPCRGTTTSAISLSVTMTSTPTVGNTLIAVVGGQFA